MRAETTGEAMTTLGPPPLGDLFAPPVVEDHGAPTAGTTTPARWRGCPANILMQRWRDLYTWVDWLLWAFDIDIGTVEEGMWWRSAGAVEELSALRDWHHELVDVAIPAPPPPDDLDRHAETAFERKERAMRSSLAAELVSWHQTRAGVCQRLFGFPSRPLLQRAAESSNGSRTWVSTCATERGTAFDRFLDELAAQNQRT